MAHTVLKALLFLIPGVLMVTLFLVEPYLYRYDAPFNWGQHAGGVMLLAVATLALAR